MKVKTKVGHIYMSGAPRDKVNFCTVTIEMVGRVVMERRYHEPYFARVYGFDGVAHDRKDAKAQALAEFTERMSTLLAPRF